MSLVNCVSEQLSFSVDLDHDIQCRKSYQLVASICHSGTLAAGHYTTHVLHKQDSQWLLCNDKAVLLIQSSEVEISIAMCFFMSCLNYFIVFFVVVFCFFSFLFLLLFFYAEQGGLTLFFSSGVTTLLMTPVTQVVFTCESLQILWEETKQGGRESDLLFGYDGPAY